LGALASHRMTVAVLALSAKENNDVTIRTDHLQLEVPRFGEFARQRSAVRSRDLSACLAIQHKTGQRLGAILVQEGHLADEDVVQILVSQARWAARMRSHDLCADGFPITRPLSLCLPCYNEEDVIGDVLAGACAVLPEFAEEFEVVVVDDGSRDRTAEIVASWSARDPRVRLVQHERNRGYGAAVTTALQAAGGEWICMTDGDGQFNLLDLPQLIVDAQKADVVVGYRHTRADNGFRKLNAHSWKWLIRCLMGLKVRDLDCAFKLFPRWVIDSLQFRAEGACISAEILTQCSRGGLTICEVPVNHFPRSAGKPTGANLGVVLKAFRELPIVWQYRNMSPWAVERQTEKAFAPVHSSNGSSADDTANMAESGDSVLAVG
jgi:hypothetical protein